MRRHENKFLDKSSLSKHYINSDKSFYPIVLNSELKLQCSYWNFPMGDKV